MPSKRFKTLAEQVAHEIKEDLLLGRWKDSLPGRKWLAQEYGVNHKTCDAALHLLASEGLVDSGRKGLGRAITAPALVSKSVSSFKVRILLYEQSDFHAHFLVELLHRLRETGYDAIFASRTMKSLGLNSDRIIRYVETVDADAWIIVAGPLDLLNWFSRQEMPAFSLYRQMRNAPIASILPDKHAAMDELLSQMVEMGHRRIQLITREDRRKPGPGAIEQGFLESLGNHGLSASSYNLPDWGDSPEELGAMLDSMFKFRSSSPTALIASETAVFFSVMQQLSMKGMVVPKHVSLACMDSSPIFEWCRPRVTHIQWNTAPLITRMLQWVHNTSKGRNDRRKNTIKAKFLAGGTIGPPHR